MHQLVPAQIITPDEIEEISGLENKNSYVLGIIARSLEAGITRSFNKLIDNLNNCGGDVTILTKDIQTALIMIAGNRYTQKLFLRKLANTCSHKMCSVGNASIFIRIFAAFTDNGSGKINPHYQKVNNIIVIVKVCI